MAGNCEKTLGFVSHGRDRLSRSLAIPRKIMGCEHGSSLAYLRGVERIDLSSIDGLEAPRLPADAVFEAFDGRDVTIDGHLHRVQVLGVHEDQEHCWVQLAVDTLESQMLTLILSRMASRHVALISHLN